MASLMQGIATVCLTKERYDNVALNLRNTMLRLFDGEMLTSLIRHITFDPAIV